MNTYHLEVLGSQWPTRQVNADCWFESESQPNMIKFYRNGEVVSVYPSDKTIITEIEYNTNEI